METSIAWAVVLYLGRSAGERLPGEVDWQHINQNSIAPQGKGTGQYVNSSLSKVSALKAGYDEAILLSPAGNVVQGTGENIFVVNGRRVVTPPVQEGLLQGITRDSVIQIARDNGYEVVDPRCANRPYLPTRRLPAPRRVCRSPRSTTAVGPAGPARHPGNMESLRGTPAGGPLPDLNETSATSSSRRIRDVPDRACDVGCRDNGLTQPPTGTRSPDGRFERISNPCGTRCAATSPATCPWRDPQRC